MSDGKAVGTIEINLSNESQVLPADGKASNKNIHIHVVGQYLDAEAMAKTAAKTMKILLEEQ